MSDRAILELFLLAVLVLGGVWHVLAAPRWCGCSDCREARP